MSNENADSKPVLRHYKNVSRIHIVILKLTKIGTRLVLGEDLLVALVGAAGMAIAITIAHLTADSVGDVTDMLRLPPEHEKKPTAGNSSKCSLVLHPHY